MDRPWKRYGYFLAMKNIVFHGQKRNIFLGEKNTQKNNAIKLKKQPPKKPLETIEILT